MNYQNDFTQKISQYLEQLRNELNEDVPRLGELVGDLTLSQADIYVEQASELLDNYHSMFRPDAESGEAGKTRTNWYQRRKVLQEYDAKIEAALPEIFEKDGYVTAAIIESQVGIESKEAEKRLRILSKKYKWRTRQDPEHPESIRYLASRLSRQSSETQPTPGKGEQG
ncbi:MAG: hypothetical protein HY051_02835 [Candidatus Aenigmarchaeota archaeon]|nr:hypothetical protein [Candidatus Aenigmarchaeota archaeon]